MPGKGKGLAIGKKTDIVEKPVNGDDDDNIINQSASGAANRINGGDGNDNIVGSALADRVNAGDGDDTVMGGAGDDILFGNDGDDTAAYEGSIFNFTWEAGKGGTLVVTDSTDTEGTDTLKHFENLQFGDYTLDLDGDNAAMILGDADLTTDEDNDGTANITAWDFDGGTPSVESYSTTGGNVSVTASSAGTAGMGTGTNVAVTFMPGSAYQYLAVGESTTETVTIVMNDGQGNLSSHDIIVTIEGRNDAPTASAIVAPDTNEDAGVVGIDLLSTASDVDASDDLDVDSVSVSSSDGRAVAFSVDNETGAFSFDAGQYNDLAVGESATVTVSYNVNDGNGGSVANAAQILVEGRNDAPTATPIAAPNTNEDAGVVGIDLLSTASDVDTSDDLDVDSVSVTSSDGRPVAFAVNTETGAFSFDAGQFNDLAVGESATVTVSYNVNDGNGGSVANTAEVVVEGRNDAPTATGDSGAVVEDSSLVATGTIAVSDPDASDTHSFSVQGGGNGNYGSLSIDGNGDWTYTLNNGAANVQALAQGQTVYENFTVNVSDGNGGFTSAPVQVAVSGTNDAPVAQDVSLVAAVTGNSGFDNGWAGWTRDAGPNGGLNGIYISGSYNHSFNINTSGSLIPGDFAVADISFGGWLNQFSDGPNLGTAFGPKLISDDFAGRSGDLVSFEYRAFSGGDAASIRAELINVDTGAVTPVFFEQTPRGSTSPVTQIDVPIAAAGNYRIEFTVGSFDATDGGYVGARLAIGTAGIVRSGVSEGDATTFEAIQFLGTATDVDNGATISLHSVDATSALGASVSIDGAGNVFYDASGITQLGAGESAVDTFTYWVTDEHGALAQAEASITVNGVNDDPTATGGTGSVTEDGTLVANGSITVSDPDANDTHSFSIQGGGAGTYGTMSVDASGNWTYNLNNGAANVQALDSGDVVVDSFVFEVDDGNGGTTTANVDINVNGQDDLSLHEFHQYQQQDQRYSGQNFYFNFNVGSVEELVDGRIRVTVDSDLDYYYNAHESYNIYIEGTLVRHNVTIANDDYSRQFDWNRWQSTEYIYLDNEFSDAQLDQWFADGVLQVRVDLSSGVNTFTYDPDTHVWLDMEYWA